MKILIVGNDPNEVGGVANYTRPLAIKFAEMGNEVFYLFSGAYASKYDLRFKPYIKLRRTEFPFECAEIYNSSCLPFNYGHPQHDVSMADMERIIGDYLDKVRPDVMHIHSRLGLPFSINRLGHDRGIAVINTIHVYGYLCQKRVMIDHEGAPCNGPYDLLKCSACTGSLNIRAELSRARIRYLKEFLKSFSGNFYDNVRRLKQTVGVRWSPGVTLSTATHEVCKVSFQLSKMLENRLRSATGVLNNYSDLIICVSQDVKNTLMSFGVKEERLLVQHIGSTIAARQTRKAKPLHDPLVFGNIGGINHYKGTHVLLDAISKINWNDFVVKIFGKYNEHYKAELMRGRAPLPIEFTGRYQLEDLPTILNQIDVMILPSICKDTAPQTIFESFSGGIPIIASNIGGFPDFVKHNENGRLFEPGNPDDLAVQINSVLENRELIMKYRTMIPQLKTMSQNAAELFELYCNYISRRSICLH